MTATLRLCRQCNGVAFGLGLALVMLGVALIAGWSFEIAALKIVFPGLVTMKVNTAIGLWASGAVLAALACGALAEYFLGWNLGIDVLALCASRKWMGSPVEFKPISKAVQKLAKYWLLLNESPRLD